MDAGSAAVEKVRALFPDQVLSVETSAGETFVNLKREKAKEILTFLRHDEELAFDCLLDVTALDYLNAGMPERFAVVYILHSFKNNNDARLKVFVPEDDPSVDSVGDLWKSAPWGEREVYDLMGIEFRGHPDLRRIVLPEYYTGHPMRKDYPLRGMGERDNFPKYVPDEDAP
jgi:NADH-quinone oxidoreductase subunit C